MHTVLAVEMFMHMYVECEVAILDLCRSRHYIVYTCTLFGLLYHNFGMKYYELKVSNRTQQTIMTLIMQSHGLYMHIE